MMTSFKGSNFELNGGSKCAILYMKVDRPLEALYLKNLPTYLPSREEGSRLPTRG